MQKGKLQSRKGILVRLKLWISTFAGTLTPQQCCWRFFGFLYIFYQTVMDVISLCLMSKREAMIRMFVRVAVSRAILLFDDRLALIFLNVASSIQDAASWRAQITFIHMSRSSETHQQAQLAYWWPTVHETNTLFVSCGCAKIRRLFLQGWRHTSSWIVCALCVLGGGTRVLGLRSTVLRFSATQLICLATLWVMSLYIYKSILLAHNQVYVWSASLWNNQSTSCPWLAIKQCPRPSSPPLLYLAHNFLSTIHLWVVGVQSSQGHALYSHLRTAPAPAHAGRLLKIWGVQASWGTTYLFLGTTLTFDEVECNQRMQQS